MLFYWQIVFTGQILVGYDLFTYFYPYKAFAAESLNQGHLPFWNPYIFMGVPFLANIQSAIFYPLNLLTTPLNPPTAVSLSIVLHVILAGLFMFAFTRSAVGLCTLASLAAGIIFMFSGFLSQQVGHINQLNASVWLPLIFLGFEQAYRRRSFLLTVLTGAALALQFLAGHTQESYLSLVGLLLFAAFRVSQEVRQTTALPEPDRAVSPQRFVSALREHPNIAFAPSAILVGAVLVGVGLAAFQLFPTYELSLQSPRGAGLTFDEARSFSLPPWLLFWSLLPGYIESPFSEFVGYIGILPAALAVLAAVKRRDHPYTGFALALGLIALFFALGGYNPFYEWLHYLVPGLNLFRVPARWLFLYTFASTILAAIAVESIAQGWQRPQAPSNSGHHSALSHWKAFLNAAPRWLTFGIVTPLTLALFWLAATKSLLPPPQTLALWALLLPTAGVLVSIGQRRGPSPFYAGVLVMLTTVELYFAGRNLDLNHPTTPDAYDTIRPTVAQLLIDKGLFRVLSIASSHFDPGDLTEFRAAYGKQLSPRALEDLVTSVKYKEVLTPNLPMLYNLSTADGYDGGILPLQRYIAFKQSLLESGRVTRESLETTDPAQPDALLRFQLEGIPDTKLLGAFNVRYIIADKNNDAWIDNVYYDLSTRLVLVPEQTEHISWLPQMAATSVGIVSHLEEAESVPQGTEVAEITVHTKAGQTFTKILRAGKDTAEGDFKREGVTYQHSPARLAAPWRGYATGAHYFTKLSLDSPQPIDRITVTYTANTGTFHLVGLSLIDDRTSVSQPVLLTSRLQLVNSGDVKVYENLDWLPRAYLVRQYDSAETVEDALVAMRDDLTEKVVLDAPISAVERVIALAHSKAERSDRTKLSAGQPAGGASPILGTSADEVSIKSYEPERVRLSAELTAPGWLVLTDSYYPGWQAYVDGEETEILVANQAFRAIYVPGGAHEIEFRYVPNSFRLGLGVTILTALACFVALIARAWHRRSPAQRYS